MLDSVKVSRLMAMVSATEEDAIDCDECFGRVPEYAERLLASLPLPAAMLAIQRHLEQCPCCRDEFEALMEGLQAVEEHGNRTSSESESGS